MTDAQQTGTTSQTARETAASIAKRRRGPIIGAIFLMATSAIGPGFITQTATFTAQLGAAFAFAILLFVVGFNGLILPIGLSIFMYIGWFRSKDVLGGYRYPKWLLVLGTLATLLSFYMGAISIGPIFAFLGIGA